jgi:hypothetical protein
MLTKMDQNTIAKMTAALEYVCKKIPADKESNELRKRIGDAIAECANSGNGSLSDFQKVGSKVLGETMRPPKSQLAWPGSAIEIPYPAKRPRLTPHQGRAFGCSTT